VARFDRDVHIEFPTTIEEAVRALDGSTTCLAGGTDFMVEVNFGHRRPDRVVALRRIEELGELNDNWIGAGVTYSRLERSKWPGLAEAARTVGSPQIRNAGTIGGNIGTASPAGDALPFLAAVDATIVTRSTDGTRELRWDEFFTGVKRTALLPNEMIVGVRLPAEMPERQGFSKIGTRSAMVISIASVCVARFSDGRVRVALGSVAPTVTRAWQAEEMISEVGVPNEAALDEFQHLVSEEARPITDHRATSRYRRHGVGVIARRTLERLL
jgi:CO/xanthine dehydrogenase FAD-binding subunit